VAVLALDTAFLAPLLDAACLGGMILCD